MMIVLGKLAEKKLSLPFSITGKRTYIFNLVQRRVMCRVDLEADAINNLDTTEQPDPTGYRFSTMIIVQI